MVHQVYENWSDGEVSRGATFTDGVANVLAPSSFCPLGEPCGEHGEYVRVMHPAFLNERSGALTTCVFVRAVRRASFAATPPTARREP